MNTTGSSAKSQEIGSKRKLKNQHEHTAKHIAWHSAKLSSLATSKRRAKTSGYQGHQYPQQRPTRNGDSPTLWLEREDFHVSGDRLFLTSNPYQQDVESRYLQDKKNGVITCLVCGNEGHYSSNCRFKDQEQKIICTVCRKNGHCSMWCCQQNKSENRACTRCGEIGHSTSTHGLGCSSCDEYHDDGECQLGEVKCFICESQDHYLAQCPLNFQGALRLALSKQGNTSSAPAKCSAKSEGKVVTANKSSPICFTCREEGHFAFQCPQNSPGQSKEFEESSTIATSSNLFKELEEREPGTGTAKQSSEMKPILYDRCCPSKAKVLTPNKSSPIVRTCKTKTQGKKGMCFTCREEGHYAHMCPQRFGAISGNTSKEVEESSTIATSSNMSKVLEKQDPGTAKQSSEMKPILYDRCCPSKAKVLTPNKSSPIVRTCKTKTQGKKGMCFTCREEGHYAHMCPQRFGAISGNTSKEVEESSTIATSSNMSKVLEKQDPGTAKQSSEMKPTSVVRCVSCGQEGHRARSCPTRVFICSTCNEEGHKAKKCPTAKQSSEMKPTSVVLCFSCGQEGHKARSCLTRVFICSTCNEEGNKTKKCPQKR